MATAYAAFTSLMHLIEDLHEHPTPPMKLDEEQFDSLGSNISFFRRFLEEHHNTVDHGLEILMADAAHSAEDLIEAHIADRIQDQEDFNGSLGKVIEGLDLIRKEVMKMDLTEQRIQPRQQHPMPSAAVSSEEKLADCFKGIRTRIMDKLTRKPDQARRHHMPLASSRSLSASYSENIVVGIEDTTVRIMGKLTCHPKSVRQIISLTGMGGVGKTTLARKIYDHPHVQGYFDDCAWATISKDYDTRENLVQLLHCLNRKSTENFSGKTESELGVILYQSLFDRKYLVILDDVWDKEAWNELKSFLPNSKGSGIVITSREASVVASIGSYNFRVDLLDKSDSWDLFCHKVFGKESCPLELEDIGKSIAKKCRGLPLSIVVIGGHLAKSPRTKGYWEYIAKNLSSVVNSENNEHCFKILSLSYTHLPVHLKPCFMYMAIFPEDKEIQVSQLTRLWVAEGFLKPIDGKCLEEAAEVYLNELMSRNLVLASRSSRRGKIIICKIHDLLRDICLKEALKKNFLRNVRKQWPGVMKVSNSERRIVVHQSTSKVINYLYGTGVLQSPTLLRTLICDGILPSLDYKSLRVLYSVSGSLIMKQKTWAKAVHSLVNLRCLRFSVSKSRRLKIPPSIVSLWNLQSIAIEDVEVIIAPAEIWKMTQLRHINVPYLLLPEPPIESNDILKKLQSAQRILNFSFSQDWVKRVPNLKKLKVEYDGKFARFKEGACTLNNVAGLKKLEIFYCYFNLVQPIARNDLLANLSFPHSLKKLTINRLRWEDVTTKIGSLPSLEALELTDCLGSEWNLVEGQFLRLKFLKLNLCDDLECFTADINHFPCLESLYLFTMPSLKEISSDIGEIATLRSIEVHLCDVSAVQSANTIAQVQPEMGNEELQIQVVILPSLSHLASESTSNFRVHVLDVLDFIKFMRENGYM